MEHLGDSGGTTKPRSDQTERAASIGGAPAGVGSIGWPHQAGDIPAASLATRADGNDLLQELWALNGPFEEPWCIRFNAETWGPLARSG